jgi:hypothetical protein
MENRTIKTHEILIIVAVATALRLFISIPNFNPMLGLALFGFIWFRKNLTAMIATFAALLVGDLYLAYSNPGYAEYFFGDPTILFVYGSILLIGIGSRLFRNRVQWNNLWAFSIGASLLFFIVSNLGVWLSGQLYSMTWEGLVSCFTLAIPFFKTELVSTLLFSHALFGIGYLLNGYRLRTGVLAQ